MRTTTNEEIIARGGRLGQLANFIGLVMVLGGLLVSFTPWKVMTVVLIALGVMMYTIGSRGLEHAGREPRFIKRLEEALAGFDDRYHLYSHVLPADHILLTPSGLFVLIMKGVDGKIRCYKDKWVRKLTLRGMLRFFTEEPLGNPTKDAHRQVEMVQKYLEEQNPELEVDVQALIVFVNPKALLEVTATSVPVLPLRRLKSYLRNASQQPSISPETVANLTQLFDQAT